MIKKFNKMKLCCNSVWSLARKLSPHVVWKNLLSVV